jgi:hypothetical protein
MSITSNLRFHLKGIEDPNEAWENMETVFGKYNDIQAYQNENQLISLNHNDFSCIEDYLSNFKTIKVLLED